VSTVEVLGEGLHLGIVSVQADQIVVQPTPFLGVRLMTRPVGLRFAVHHRITVS
jgi:hypothetical protein